MPKTFRFGFVKLNSKILIKENKSNLVWQTCWVPDVLRATSLKIKVILFRFPLRCLTSVSGICNVLSNSHCLLQPTACKTLLHLRDDKTKCREADPSPLCSCVEMEHTHKTILLPILKESGNSDRWPKGFGRGFSSVGFSRFWKKSMAT